MQDRTGWQPYGTCPKTPYRDTLIANDRGVFLASWSPDHFADGEGWWIISDGKNEMPLRGNEPSHWQPAPEAPK